MKKKKVLCYGLLDFLNIMGAMTGPRRILPGHLAVVSICPSETKTSGEFHYFGDARNVLNMDFDDGGPEEYWDGEDRYDNLFNYWMSFGNDYSKLKYAFDFTSNHDKESKVHFLDYGQAYRMVEFIDNMMTDDSIDAIYVHCTAGLSRSQGVVRYIIDTYDGNGYEIEINKNNPCMTPNAHVTLMLKRVSWLYFDRHNTAMKYENFITETPDDIVPKRDVYEINVTNTFDDRRDDEENSSYDVESLFEDELWFLMLCYFSNNWLDEQLSFCAQDRNSRNSVCGRDLLNDANFPWLYDYFHFDTSYVGMGLCIHPLRLYSPYYDMECNVIKDIEIFHWLSDGSRQRVTLPTMNRLFKTREEMIEYMTGLFEELKNKRKRN